MADDRTVEFLKQLKELIAPYAGDPSNWTHYSRPPKPDRGRERSDASAASTRQRRSRERVELGSSRRDEIRTRQPGQRRGPPDPDPDPLLAALDNFASALAVLRQELIAARAKPKEDLWIPQGESPLQPRVHARLCRELMARGDERATKRGRTHYLRQSAIDEHLRGAPQKKRHPVESSVQLSAGDRLLAEIGGAR